MKEDPPNISAPNEFNEYNEYNLNEATNPEEEKKIIENMTTAVNMAVKRSILADRRRKAKSALKNK